MKWVNNFLLARDHVFVPFGQLFVVRDCGFQSMEQLLFLGDRALFQRYLFLKISNFLFVVGHDVIS